MNLRSSRSCFGVPRKATLAIDYHLLSRNNIQHTAPVPIDSTPASVHDPSACPAAARTMIFRQDVQKKTESPHPAQSHLLDFTLLFLLLKPFWLKRWYFYRNRRLFSAFSTNVGNSDIIIYLNHPGRFSWYICKKKRQGQPLGRFFLGKKHLAKISWNSSPRRYSGLPMPVGNDKIFLPDHSG